MKDKEIQEYIDHLDEEIQLEEQAGYREDTEEHRQSQIRIFSLKEIQEHIRADFKKLQSKLSPLPDNDLVDKIWIVNQDNLSNSIKAKEEIRKLLQGRQPEKLTVTRERIKFLVFDIQNCGTPRPCSSCIDSVIALFNVNGVRVVEK